MGRMRRAEKAAGGADSPGGADQAKARLGSKKSCEDGIGISGVPGEKIS